MWALFVLKCLSDGALNDRDGFSHLLAFLQPGAVSQLGDNTLPSIKVLIDFVQNKPKEWYNNFLY